MNWFFIPLVTFASILFSNVGFAFETVNPVEEMRENINALGSGTSFAFVDIGLTEEELALADRLKFDNLGAETTKQYDRFGNLHLIIDELPKFLREIGNDDEEVIQAVTAIISRTAYNVTEASNKASAWVCVRASTPNHQFDMPRWHTDGMYYGLDSSKPYPEIVFKFGAVLKGPPTLLYPLPDAMRETFYANEDDRQFLSELLDLRLAQSPEKGQGVLFIVADNTMGGVHSEPKMDENRLFFSILVGDQIEIDELNSRWHPQ